MKLTKGIIWVLAVGLLCLPSAASAYNFFEAWPSNTDDGATAELVDPELAIDIHPIPYMDLWYSTEIDFTSAPPTGTHLTRISDGDLLSMYRCRIKTNFELCRRLGVMPMIPDLGLDAVTRPYWWPVPTPVAISDDEVVCPTPSAEVKPYCKCILFSIEERVFSETLGWIGHGDLLCDCGRIVRTNWELVRWFRPTCPACVCPVDCDCDASYISAECACCLCRDLGLDAVDEGVFGNYCTGFLFSTEVDFYSRRLEQWVGHGDLLSELGYIYRSNAQLMANFQPYDPLAPDDVLIADHDFGLDAVYVSKRGVIWFSVEEGFYDRTWGYISDGDVLSESGRVIYRNLDVVRRCYPLEDCANFGLDALERYPDWPYQIEPVEQMPIEIEPVAIGG
ncbi:MAG: hypothetical protein KAV82_16955 [Phycisphaerae bacterium]|nr:hypothetical protein [Phycisphaerae bacterium]